MQENTSGNRLSLETSPYLLQHANNPVHWQPWDAQALALAASENKPILLSIGYSACHWCHVMAHESFEDEATAALMNEYFVNIKVDREERPDLDRIYQNAYRLLNQSSGGWPLTMILTPDDHVPFFGGTYFPLEARQGMPSFKDLMTRLMDYYRAKENEVREQNTSLLAALKAGPSRVAKTGYAMNPAPLEAARDHLVSIFDEIHGGFGGAPKFPYPTSLERLQRHLASHPDDEETRQALSYTLVSMAEGGVFDHVGGGFFRYSVDEFWMIPHFEKMLYDNGLLLGVYANAWKALGDPIFRRTAKNIADWAIDEMQSSEGAFYSSMDADSEGGEGVYYVWTKAQVKETLSYAEYSVVGARYGLSRAANFEGCWHLHADADLQSVAAALGLEIEEVSELLASARIKLGAVRAQRIAPARDEKILTAWNGLMIKGLALAGRHLNAPEYTDAAELALDHIKRDLWRDGRLLAARPSPTKTLSAYLDDYVFLIDGILELLQTRWRDGDLDFAIELADVLLEHFQEEKKGGFFFTSDEHEALIQRPRPTSDDSVPSGNGVAAQVLLRLGRLLGSMKYLVAAERTLKWTWPMMEQSPAGSGSLLAGIEDYYSGGKTIVIRAQGNALEQWKSACEAEYAPLQYNLSIPVEAKALPGLLAERVAGEGDALAYVCEGSRCLAPLEDLEGLKASLRESQPFHAGRQKSSDH